MQTIRQDDCLDKGVNKTKFGCVNLLWTNSAIMY